MTTQTNGTEGVLTSREAIASTERGAWTCRACGFQGFWKGGAHCMGRELEDAFSYLEQRCAELGYPWDE